MIIIYKWSWYMGNDEIRERGLFWILISSMVHRVQNKMLLQTTSSIFSICSFISLLFPFVFRPKQFTLFAHLLEFTRFLIPAGMRKKRYNTSNAKKSNNTPQTHMNKLSFNTNICKTSLAKIATMYVCVWVWDLDGSFTFHSKN